MRNGRKFGLLIAVLVMVGVMASPAFAATQKVTVGDLYLKIADAKGLRSADAITAEAALRKAGYDLPRLDRSKALTEGDVAAISSAVGVRVASSNPTAAFGEARLDRFMTSMSSEISSSGRISAGADNGRVSTESSNSMSGSGKGKKKPHSKSPKKPKKPKPPKPPKT